MWAIIGASVVAAGVQLGHPGLTGWGTILVAASLIASAAGMPLAAHRGRAARQQGPRNRRSRWQAHTPADRRS